LYIQLTITKYSDFTEKIDSAPFADVEARSRRADHPEPVSRIPTRFIRAGGSRCDTSIPRHDAGICAEGGGIYEVNWDMKLIVIIRAAALFSALITVSTTTAAALSCDCGDICMSNKRLVE